MCDLTLAVVIQAARTASYEKMKIHFGDILRGGRLDSASRRSTLGTATTLPRRRGGLPQARARYRRLAEKVQDIFVKYVETVGWPPAGRLANVDAFDRLVADRLKESGRKVAYQMVDALRYELGVALEKLLAEDGPVELQARLRSVTNHHPGGYG